MNNKKEFEKEKEELFKWWKEEQEKIYEKRRNDKTIVGLDSIYDKQSKDLARRFNSKLKNIIEKYN